MRAAVLFCGGGILDAAIIQKDIDIELAVEGDPKRAELSGKIADVYALNYGEEALIRSPVEDVSFTQFMGQRWGLLHASPSCKNFSIANKDGEETKADIKSALGTIRAIECLRPDYFTLEQVRGYTKTHSFDLILRSLKNQGYTFTYDVLNAYYYGVPQERERLMLTASRKGDPVGLPPVSRPTGWGEVLRSRIPHLNSIEPSTKQKEAVKETLDLYPTCKALLVQKRGYRDALAVRQFWQSAPVITCSLFTDGKGANRRSYFDVWIEGEWRSLSIRDMAKLQTIPDWYILPSETAIAGTIIGNGVPPKLYDKVLDLILRHSERFSS